MSSRGTWEKLRAVVSGLPAVGGQRRGMKTMSSVKKRCEGCKVRLFLFCFSASNWNYGNIGIVEEDLHAIFGWDGLSRFQALDWVRKIGFWDLRMRLLLRFK